jgi:preprotein translocase subunit SecG
MNVFFSMLFGVLMFVTALFLILLVLVQRGRGGGLSGALGGMGGQSAFGTKAGDLFTRITIVVAAFWVLLCISAILVLNRQTVAAPEAGDSLDFTTAGSEPAGPGPEAKPADGADATLVSPPAEAPQAEAPPAEEPPAEEPPAEEP